MPEQRVLVTGSAGVMGRYVCRQLMANGHFVRGFDLRPSDASEAIVGNLVDAAALADAARDIDCIIHLAAFPDDADFTKRLVPNNVIGLYNACEAAKQSETVSRLVLASSDEVIYGLPWRQQPICLEDGVYPENHYALLKLYAEQMGQMYHRLHGLSVVAVRLGWLPRTAEHLEKLENDPLFHTHYLSGDDAGRFFACSVEAPGDQIGRFAIVFATSKPPAGTTIGFDLEPARRLLGFEPKDTYPAGAGEHLNSG